MKAIIVYYSLEGNTEYVADTIAENLRVPTLRLVPVKDYPTGNSSKYIWGGKSVVFGEKPKLIPYQFDAKDYDTIIIGTPIWASSFTPPIKTFLKENDLSSKKIALYACSAGGDSEKCFNKFKLELPNNDIIATLTLIDPKTKASDVNAQQIKIFCDKISQYPYDKL